MKHYLTASAVALSFALCSATTVAKTIVTFPALLIERHFDHLAHRDMDGYQAIQIALESPSNHDNPRNGKFESTELNNYGHAWVYLNALADHVPLSSQALTSKRAYACYLSARRNAIASAGNVEDDVTGEWLDLADRCAAILYIRFSQWVNEISLPLERKDLEGSTPYRMFFHFDANGITEISDNILQYIALFEGTGGSAKFIVEGHADRSGGEIYNLTLSQKRAVAVGTRFSTHMKHGITQLYRAVGETKPLAATEDGIRHPRNRRVEIVVNRSSN